MAQYSEKQFSMKDGRNYVLRSARKEDASLVYEYVQNIFKEASYILTHIDDFNASLEDEARFLEELDQSPSGIMLIALFEGRVIGNIDIRSSRYQRTAHRAAFGMSVLKEFRGQSIGRQLLGELIHFVKNQTEIKKLELGVIDKNISAIKLYESLGFKEEGRSIKGFRTDSGEYRDEILMGQWLD